MCSCDSNPYVYATGVCIGYYEIKDMAVFVSKNEYYEVKDMAVLVSKNEYYEVKVTL